MYRTAFFKGNYQLMFGTYDINDKSAHINKREQPRTNRTRIVGDTHNKGNTHVHSSIGIGNVTPPPCEHSQLPKCPNSHELRIPY